MFLLLDVLPPQSSQVFNATHGSCSALNAKRLRKEGTGPQVAVHQHCERATFQAQGMQPPSSIFLFVFVSFPSTPTFGPEIDSTPVSHHVNDLPILDRGLSTNISTIVESTALFDGQRCQCSCRVVPPSTISSFQSNDDSVDITRS